MNYETAQELYDALSAPFPSEMIDWRLGSTNPEKTQGMALAYVDARAVMDRLDTVCGPENWQNRYSPGVGGSIVCDLGIRFPGGDWIWKSDGAGATDVEGEKGALSDAIKRSAVRFGVGRYLYDLKSPWVDIVPAGKSFRIKDRKPLDAVHEDFAAKAGWGQRAGIQAYRLLAKVAREYVTDANSAQDFKTKNSGEIALLPVAMRRHLIELLDRIGGEQMEAAE